MPFAQDVFVSTTSSVQNAEVTAYHDVIASHVVAGTGLFSDVAASFSDVFGGRSKSYQKQLSKINEEAVRQLKEEAASMGANGIIGLRIDHDQVSSQGKAMFMVTASGTAVKMEFEAEKACPVDSGAESTVTGDELATELRKQEVLSKLEANDFEFGEEEMTFLRENRVEEAALLLINHLENQAAKRRDGGIEPTYKKRSRAYFMSIPDKRACECLYSAIFEGSRSVSRWAFDIIKERELFDADWAERLIIKGSGMGKKKSGLHVIRINKPSYSADDIPKLESLLSTVESSFPPVVEIIEKEHTFASKTTTMWKCVCGEENDMDDARCSRCQRDRRGFEPSEWDPEQAASLLKQKIRILKSRCGEDAET